ncbi:MAG TPA: hypothetical protein VHU43_05320, partial [Steroidobacteraceae bacterium]|nr:hypothetical protein [Steroidobacteraceae bacterium]
SQTHPTSSGTSHLLTGILLGVSHNFGIQKHWNSRRFIVDFGSVPGSQILEGSIDDRRLTQPDA